jgi:hypothetical protein
MKDRNGALDMSSCALARWRRPLLGIDLLSFTSTKNKTELIIAYFTVQHMILLES